MAHFRVSSVRRFNRFVYIHHCVPRVGVSHVATSLCLRLRTAAVCVQTSQGRVCGCVRVTSPRRHRCAGVRAVYASLCARQVNVTFL